MQSTKLDEIAAIKSEKKKVEIQTKQVKKKYNDYF